MILNENETCVVKAFLANTSGRIIIYGTTFGGIFGKSMDDLYERSLLGIGVGLGRLVFERKTLGMLNKQHSKGCVFKQPATGKHWVARAARSAPLQRGACACACFVTPRALWAAAASLTRPLHPKPIGIYHDKHTLYSLYTLYWHLSPHLSRRLLQQAGTSTASLLPLLPTCCAVVSCLVPWVHRASPLAAASCPPPSTTI